MLDGKKAMVDARPWVAGCFHQDVQAVRGDKLLSIVADIGAASLQRILKTGR